MFAPPVPGPPMNVSAFCDVVVWEDPERSNGVITGYEVMFTFSNGSSTTIPVLRSINFLIMRIQIPRDAMSIKVFLRQEVVLNI